MKQEPKSVQTIGQRCARRLCQGEHLAPHLSRAAIARVITEELANLAAVQSRTLSARHPSAKPDRQGIGSHSNTRQGRGMGDPTPGQEVSFYQ